MAQVIYSEYREYRFKNKFSNISEGGSHVINIKLAQMTSLSTVHVGSFALDGNLVKSCYPKIC